MQKIEARQFFLQKRKTLSPAACSKMDDLLLIQFQKMNWEPLSCVGNFYPMEKQNEPNSFLLTKYLQFLFPTIKIAYPRVLHATNTMEFFEATETFTQNKWGIREPYPIHKIDVTEMEAVFIPLLGFDTFGHRIGFGKGFYDKYFEHPVKNALRIGISYFEPILKLEDTNQFDVPLTHCITPSKIYEF